MKKETLDTLKDLLKFIKQNFRYFEIRENMDISGKKLDELIAEVEKLQHTEQCKRCKRNMVKTKQSESEIKKVLNVGDLDNIRELAGKFLDGCADESDVFSLAEQIIDLFGSCNDPK